MRLFALAILAATAGCCGAVDTCDASEPESLARAVQVVWVGVYNATETPPHTTWVAHDTCLPAVESGLHSFYCVECDPAAVAVATDPAPADKWLSWAHALLHVRMRHALGDADLAHSRAEWAVVPHMPALLHNGGVF